MEVGIGVAVALLASFLACRVLVSTGPIDHGREQRKAHARPTPPSGGIGIGFAAGLATLQWGDDATLLGGSLASSVTAFALPFLLIGYLDDALQLGARLKFVLFASLALWASFIIGVVEELPLGADVSVPLGFAIGLAGTALWVFTLVNCVNFMDGANGLAMGSVAIGLVALAAAAQAFGSASGVAIGLCGAGALIGFLFWNFPNGRLFAGDSGALFAGAVAALASLVVIHQTGLSPFVPPILFFPLLADALLTLAWRARRRRSLLDGHAEHLYQIALRAGWSHARVALVYWAASAACGAVAFFAAMAPQSGAPWLALSALAAMSVVTSTLVRRAAVRRGIAEL